QTKAKRGGDEALRRLEEEYAQRRQRDLEAVGVVTPRLVGGPHEPAIAQVAPAVHLGVAVQQLPPVSTAWDAQAVGVSRHAREVADYHSGVVRIMSPTEEGEAAVFVVVDLQPLEARPVEVHLVQRRFGTVQPVEISHPALQARLERVLEEVPVETLGLAPL